MRNYETIFVVNPTLGRGIQRVLKKYSALWRGRRESLSGLKNGGSNGSPMHQEV